jgi:hypothetical protein
MIELVILIIVGSFAIRGASSLAHTLTQYGVPDVPLFFSGPPGSTIVSLYVIAAFPLAFLNGFLLRFSWGDCAIAGIGTWLGMLISNVLFRFNPAIQFMVFGFVNLIWLIISVLRTLGR